MKLFHRIRTQFRKEKLDKDLSDELAFHLQQETEENIASGMTPDEAHYAAMRKFGGIDQVKEECRDAWGLRFVENLLQDLRFGLRMLAKSPSFTAVAVLTLALGIGGATIIFSLFDAVFLRTLPLRHPEQLVRMVQHYSPKLPPQSNFRYVYYEALRDHATTLTDVFAETGQNSQFAMSDPAPAEEISVSGVTPDFFTALSVRALYGRVLLPDDANESAGLPPAVLSYEFWQRRFRRDPRVVNKETILVNGQRYVVVGVLPRDFNGLSVDTAPDVRIPLRAHALLVKVPAGRMWYELAGRLKPGVSGSHAEAECRVLWRSTMESYLRDVEKYPPQLVAALLADGMEVESVARGVSLLRNRYGDVIKLLMASIALLLLIVCTNVAGLLLERGAARQREIAVRLAVGATRFRLVRQVLAENILLAGMGAAAALAISVGGMPLVVRGLPPIRDYPATTLAPLSIDVSINLRVFLFLLVLSLLATLLFSMSPALAVSRLNLDSLLRTTRSSSGMRGRQTLIALQIAFCTVLLAIAGLFVRTFQQLQRVDPGFDRDHVATFTINLEGYTGKAAAFLTTFTDHVRAIPGVVSVGTSSVGVMRGSGLSTSVAPAGQRITPADFLDASINSVSTEYFDTMGIHILAGRDFVSSDRPVFNQKAPMRIVVNQAFAQRFFPGAQPLGKRFGTGNAGDVAKEWYEIIGVVSDSKYRSLRAPVVPTVYTLQTDFDEFVLNVRTRTPPQAIIEPVRKILASIAPGLPLLEVHTLAEEVHDSLAGERITAAIASLFGGLAALLVGVGIYGLLAYVVMQRRREIGIRMALGAERRDVLNLIVGQGFKLAVIGLGIGLLGSLAATHFFASLLYGVKPTDPLTFVVVALLLAAVAVLASYIPARRATKVDPMVALRHE